MTTETQSLFTRIGGKDAISAAVDAFYERVLNDSLLVDYFANTDMVRQRAKMKGFMTMALGGPVAYTGLDLRERHASLVEKGMGDPHFDAVMDHLANTLAKLGVAPEQINEVAAICESVRDDVLCR